MAIMSYDEWMRRTKLGVMKPRSKSLKVLDSALKAFKDNGASSVYLEALIAAFNAWALGKDAGFENSERNKGGAITDLMNQIIEFQRRNQPGGHLRPPSLLKDIREGADNRGRSPRSRGA